MEKREERLIKLATEYMDYIEELVGVGNEDIVVGLINKVHTILTDKSEPVLKLRYLDEGDITEEELEDMEEGEVNGRKYRYSRKDVPEKTENINFPNLSAKLSEDIEDALGFVADVFEDVTFALESSEGDNEILRAELAKKDKRNEHLSDQAKKLYQLNEYQSIQIRDLEEAMDEIFLTGNSQEVDKENTEEEGDIE